MKAVGLLSIFVFFLMSASAQDRAGSSDHPAITRYEGQVITQYDYKEFDKYNLVLSVDKSGAPGDVRELEGKVFRIVYKNPPKRSTHEIYRNFEQALQNSHASILYKCEGRACGTPIRWQQINGVRAMGGQLDNRYIACRMMKDDTEIYASIFIGSQATQMHIVEIRPMESGLVKVDADVLGSDIDREGHVAVYAILFDTGKSTLKPESAEAISEIAKLLKQRPELKLHVVGHTDNTGGYDLNMNLSNDRAMAVVKALVSGHGIVEGRLKAHGIGPLAPVSTNATEEGKAKNRRVELVAQ